MIEFVNGLGWFSGSCLVLALILGIKEFRKKKKNQPDPPDYINSVPFITWGDCELCIVLAVLFLVFYIYDKKFIQGKTND